MNDIAIRIRNLSKVYQYDPKFNQNIRERMFEKASMPKAKSIVALQDINIDIEKGSVLGIIGDNGSGKSTLLKVISGITQPSTGTVEIFGNVASILEVGTGFHPDLNGRENIFLSGTLMGMKKNEIRKKFNDIVEFSEIGDFIEMPVKHYSSGMFMRLAFAMITSLNADVVLLDEVFSVGDLRFRMKSENRIIDLSNTDKTVIVVSHDLNSIRKLCNYCMILSDGHVKTFGKIATVLDDYIFDKVIKRDDKVEMKFAPEEQETEAKPELDEHTNGQEAREAALENEELAAVEAEAAGAEAQENTSGPLVAKEKVLDAEAGDENSGLEDGEETDEDEAVLKALSEEPEEEEDPINVLKREGIEDVNFKKLTWEEGEHPSNDKVKVLEISYESLNEDHEKMYCDTAIRITVIFEKSVDYEITPALGLTYQYTLPALVANPRLPDDKSKMQRFEEKGIMKYTCVIPRDTLNYGIFGLSVYLLDDDINEILSVENALFFRVHYMEDHAELYGDSGSYMGPLKPKFTWEAKKMKRYGSNKN